MLQLKKVKASEVTHTSENAYGLVGCTVAPGFDFQDFEMAKKDQLVAAFPQHQKLITRLTQ